MMMMKCHGCGAEKETDKKPKEFCCKDCGAINVVNYHVESGEQAASCIPPTSFEWTLPAGQLQGPNGPLYITAQGSIVTKEEYIECFGIDPDLAKAWMKKMGEEGKEGFKNLSTMGKKK